MVLSALTAQAGTLKCYDTGEYTINKVRTAQDGKEQIIIGSSYNGDIVAMDYSGEILWANKTGDGTQNHDIWCDDITGDNRDEIFAANGDGYIYCFDLEGKQMWKYTPHEGVHQTPMYTVTVVRDNEHTPYVVCGNFDTFIYYLDANGKQVKALDSRGYSLSKTWGKSASTPPSKIHYANYLRPIPQKDGSDLLLVHGTNNHMQGVGIFYIFKPLADKPIFTKDKIGTKSEIADLRVIDPDGDGLYEILHSSTSLRDGDVGLQTFTDDSYTECSVNAGSLSVKLVGVAYKVNQSLPVYDGKGGFEYITLSSNKLITYDMSKKPIFGKDKHKNIYTGSYAFFDAWSDKSGKLILASSIDGGSCIYVFNTTKANWYKEFETLKPKGKIAALEQRHAEVRELLKDFKKPEWQRDPVKVTGMEGSKYPTLRSLKNKESIELFDLLGSPHKEVRDWRLAPPYAGTIYAKDKRDKRMKYDWTQEQLLEDAPNLFKGIPGITMWGGHGNDPLYFQLSTLTGIADIGHKMGKKSIFVYPEMNSHDGDFEILMQNQIYPLADHLSEIDGHICLRNKNIYFQGPIYTKPFAPIIAGEYADVFIPAMEESTDKSQDLSIVGRMGLWMAGSVNGWAVRTTRDESSFDRSRQYSSQTVANHFFRQTVLSLACGAKYIHNTYMNPDHMGLYLELLDKEALFVPERDEIVSLSPVHIAMHEPSEEYLESAENHKWNICYDREYEYNNPFVFSHLNGSWLGADLTPWDFSTYASGVKDRRQNFIPSWPNGTVLITPVQEGPLADKDAPRGKMEDKLHPIYKGKCIEYITNGKDYISADGTKHFRADEYYKNVERDIIEGAKMLPINVSPEREGNRFGWVVAEMAPTHLRLTLVDGGFLNPQQQNVKVHFNTVKPVKVRDVLDGKCYEVKNGECIIDIPCGMFRFIDIEIAEPLK